MFQAQPSKIISDPEQLKERIDNLRASQNKELKVGYATGVYDLFSHGHRFFLTRASCLCDFLVVSVNSNRQVQNRKNKTPICTRSIRAQSVANLDVVDAVLVMDHGDDIQVTPVIESQIIEPRIAFFGCDYAPNTLREEWKKFAPEIHIIKGEKNCRTTATIARIEKGHYLP